MDSKEGEFYKQEFYKLQTVLVNIEKELFRAKSVYRDITRSYLTYLQHKGLTGDYDRWCDEE